MKSLFLLSFCIGFLINLLKIIFLVKGITSKIPIMSVANPGIISSSAANAKVAPENIS